jgi:glycine dehydrogenase subunit 1
MASMGKTGLQQVANLSTQKAHYAADLIGNIPGFSLAYPNASFFKEFVVACPVPGEEINALLWGNGMIGGYPLPDNRLLIAVTEQRTKDEIDRFAEVLRATSV